MCDCWKTWNSTRDSNRGGGWQFRAWWEMGCTGVLRCFPLHGRIKFPLELEEEFESLHSSCLPLTNTSSWEVMFTMSQWDNWMTRETLDTRQWCTQSKRWRETPDTSPNRTISWPFGGMHFVVGSVLSLWCWMCRCDQGAEWGFWLLYRYLSDMGNRQSEYQVE